MSTKTSQELFRSNAVALVETIADMIRVIRDVDLGNVNEEEVEDLAAVVDSIQAIELVEMFILQEELWPKIVARDTAFIRQDLPRVFEGVAFNIDLLMLPIAVYYDLVNGKYTDQFSNEDWPITSEDIDGLWNYCDKLLRHAYNYAKTKGNALGQITDTANTKIATINIDRKRMDLQPLPLKRRVDLSLYEHYIQKLNDKLKSK